MNTGALGIGPPLRADQRKCKSWLPARFSDGPLRETSDPTGRKRLCMHLASHRQRVFQKIFSPVRNTHVQSFTVTKHESLRHRFSLERRDNEPLLLAIHGHVRHANASGRGREFRCLKSQELQHAPRISDATNAKISRACCIQGPRNLVPALIPAAFSRHFVAA